MGWIIKAFKGESVQDARNEIERVGAQIEAEGKRVRRLSPTALEVEGGARKATEEVIDSPTNWEHSAVYMDSDDPVQLHLPAE